MLADTLTAAQRAALDALLEVRDDSRTTWLAWLREAPLKANSRAMNEHIDRLRKLRSLSLPVGVDRLVHRNRLLKLAREGAQMTVSDLTKFESRRRYATLIALVFEATATVTDEIIDTHDRIVGKAFNAAKHRHEEQVQRDGKVGNDKVRLYAQVGQLLVDAKHDGTDPIALIDAALTWDVFVASVVEAQQLSQPEDFDFLHRLTDAYPMLRRYTPGFLDVLDLEHHQPQSGFSTQ